MFSYLTYKLDSIKLVILDTIISLTAMMIIIYYNNIVVKLKWLEYVQLE